MKTKRDRRVYRASAVVLFLLLGCLLWAQNGLPDAPTPQNNVPPPAQAAAPEAPAPSAPANTPPPSSSTEPASQAPAQEPNPSVKTVPPGKAADVPHDDRDVLVKLSVNVNFVTVPVTVKDRSGHLVSGLLKNDFSVYEDNVKQNVTFFTSDPFPLSAAVVLDTALPDITWRKVRDTMSALVGAFSQYDEVAIFTYGNTVQKRQDFTGANADRLANTMRLIRRESGRTGGVPVVGGPFGGGPSINGKPVDPSLPHVQTLPKESYVLNDAILAAAQELGRRDPSRRKVLFVISDGREMGSANGYADVLRVLLTRQISVYAVGVGNAAIPGYRQLEKVRVPGLGYGNILPKYASATGGQVYSEVNQQAIEDAYSRVTNEARNQYTIGYNTRSTPSSSYRSIEVRVHRPNLLIYTRDGYYPLPPAPPGR